MTTPAPPDQAARQRIVTDLRTNLFVEAGAGAGKTTSLVGRILAMVADPTDPVDITAIAAITFTEKAAAELRHRTRAALVKESAKPDLEPDVRARFERALDRLDHAPIGTLHAFARRMLNEFPVAAALPPGFTVLDEIESGIRFAERFDELVDRLFAEPDPPGGPVEGGALFVELCKRDEFGLLRGLRTVAADFHDNWDLVQQHVSLDPPPAWSPDPAATLAAAEAVLAVDCPPDDSQAGHCGAVRDAVGHLRQAVGITATLDALATLRKAAWPGRKAGDAKKWGAHSSVADRDALKDAHLRLVEAADEQLNAGRAYRRALLGAVLGRWVLDSATDRAADGTLEFHDLLVLARRLLAHHPDARAALHDRYRRVLLDEFQDTDPIQLDIAVLLTCPPDQPDGLPVPGRLFIVGDPKQSIYRFRRADIANYLRAADRVAATEQQLTANFRSSSAVIGWVNQVFAEMIIEQPDAQPAYRHLDVCRPGPVGHGTVRVLGSDEHTDLPARGGATELREREAADVAAAVVTALEERWQVGCGLPDGSPGLRDCTPGDVTILLPARTSLPALEVALRAAGVPYRAENSSVVYLTSEIRHLMLALRAADDASDELALVAALRTPLYGISDPELYEWRQGGGRWNVWSAIPDALGEHPVAAALGHLREIARASPTTVPADLLARLVDDRRLLDAALDSPDARDVWRRVRYVIEQARAWSDAGGHGLRRYLRWVSLQAAEARSADTVLPERDHDAVRVMTIHAAKGLEFPITIVSGLSTRPQGVGGYHVVWTGQADEPWGLAKQGDSVFDDFKPIDEQMSDAERRRMLYVACTRAVDHLVVSLHRKTRGGGQPTNAELIVECGGLDAAGAVALATGPATYTVTPPPTAEVAWADPDVWAGERERAIAAARVVDVVSPTALARGLADLVTLDTGLDKEPVDLDLPPWQRGRYGTAVGRAVHAVLQYCDLRTGADIDAQSAAQCAAEGIVGQDELVAALARSAIAVPAVREALDRPHHRELFVAAPIGGRVLEGYIDLFVDAPDGGVIVDYKTDQWPDHAERVTRIGKYRLQLAAYAVALARITGRLPASGVLVRCRPDGPAEQIDIPEWPAALAAAEAAAATFAE